MGITSNVPSQPRDVMIRSTKMTLQLTLAILKPDVTPMTYAMLNIRDRMLDGGFLIVRTKRVRLGRERAEQFYAEHEGKVTGILDDDKK